MRISVIVPVLRIFKTHGEDCVDAGVKFITDGVTLRDFTTSHGKHVAGTLVIKRQFLDWLLTQADGMFPNWIALKLRDIFRDYASFRSFRPLEDAAAASGGGGADRLFMAEWPLAARLFATFVGDAVFQVEPPYVYPFQQIARQGRGAAAVLEFSAIDEMWKKIQRVAEEAKQDEKVLAAKAGPGPVPWRPPRAVAKR